MFIPTTKEEVKKLNWDSLDIILITGDSYIDSPFVGVSIIGKFLIKKGFRVGIIAQPDINSKMDICRLGEPELFWGISGGCIDSMVANHTASKKKRKKDDYTAGGQNTRRPDRAVIVYSNLVRKYFKNTKPLVLGGIEASLRRIPHYDFWSNSLRKSIIFDAKADYIVYGMGEKTTIELAERLKAGKDTKDIPGICYISGEPRKDYIRLCSFNDLITDKNAFIDMFDVFYKNNDPIKAKGLYQKHDTRYLIHNPPAPQLLSKELDDIYDMDFERDLHPYYKKNGSVRALDTIKFSIPTHRGCYGECNFCAITVHEGTTVSWRSEKSIIREAKQIAALPDFKGYILDVGGPTANMYGFECEKKLIKGRCLNKRCMYPSICSMLKPDHKKQLNLLINLRKINRVKKIFISSGIRYDLLLDDKINGEKYLKEIILHHISGQLKIAPEHTEEMILNLMGKPGTKSLLEFVDKFYKQTKAAGKEQFLTYYFMVSHPGCNKDDIKKMKSFISNKLKINTEQVQIFTPTPSTYSTLMYYTEINPFNKNNIYVEKDMSKKEKLKNIITSKHSKAAEKK